MRRLDRFDEAEAYIRKALAMFETAAAGEPSFDVAWALANLGIVLGQRGDKKGKLAAFKRAVENFVATIGPEHSQTADAFEKRGNARTEAGRVAEGEAEICAAPWEIKRARFGLDNPSTALTTKFLADHYRERKMYREALPLYLEAERANSVTLGPTDKMVGRVLEGLGLTQLALGDVKAAVATLERSRRLVETEAGDAEKVADVEMSLAQALWQDGQRGAGARGSRPAIARLLARPRRRRPRRAGRGGGLAARQAVARAYRGGGNIRASFSTPSSRARPSHKSA
ncbi:MAG: tetratricopeptide repeat protein [Verrucomicrobiota bacterium]